MENLKDFDVQEIEISSQKRVCGGTWLGKSVGKLIGAIIRYSGPTGVNNACADVGYYMANQ